MGKISMARRVIFTVVCGVALLMRKMGADALCAQPSMYIETTKAGLPISGCFKNTTYAGLYETTVWTMDGSDISSSGTTAVVADLQNETLADPFWTIGTVVSNSANSWSDGYAAGLVVVDAMCVGGSPFWETEDPTEESLWQCDTNGDGVMSVEESGDFDSITCGCPEETPSPAIVEVSPAPIAANIEGVTSAPLAVVPPSTAPVVGTTSPVATRAGGATEAPASGGTLAPEALACNLTLTLDSMEDVNGCYIGSASSSERGLWELADSSARVEWQISANASESGSWAIVTTGVSGTDQVKCFSEQNVRDPADIPSTLWLCDVNGDSEYSAAETGGSLELACTAECSATGEDEEGSGSGSSSTTAIIVGSVVGGVLLAGMAAAVIFFVKRKNRVQTQGRKAPAAVEKTVTPPADANAAPVGDTVPVFEPWGSRPPPKYYG